MMIMIDVMNLYVNDLVYSEVYGGCAIVSSYVHSYDKSFMCSYVWCADKREMYSSVSVSIDEIREPTYEEVCEFMRQYVPIIQSEG